MVSSQSLVVAVFPSVTAQPVSAATSLKDALRQLPHSPMAALATEHCIGTAAHGSSGISGWEQESDHRLNG